MFRLRMASIVGCALVTALLAHAQEVDLKDLVRKSIAAHGGEKSLEKFKAVQTKFKGKIHVAGLMADLTGETFLQKPDKVKNMMKLDIGGKTIDVVTVFDSKKLYVSTNGMTKEVTDEKVVKAAKEELETEGAASMVEWLKPPFELNALGETKIKGKDTIGIRVSKKGSKDFSIYLDKKTYLVVKTETRTLDAMSGQEVTQEKFVLDYHEKDGLKLAKRVDIVRDEKPFMEIEITEVQPLEKIDPAVFAKP